MPRPSFAQHPAHWKASELAVQLKQGPDSEPGQILDELEHGRGLVLLRGLARGQEAGQAKDSFCRLTNSLGTPLPQTVASEDVLAVEDQGFAPEDPRFRGPHSSARLSYHCDRCDVIAFLCLRPAARGGRSYVVSSVRLYERLRQEQPELLDVLHGGFPFLRHTIDPANPKPWVELPIFSSREGHFAAHLLRVLIERADAHPEAPSLSAVQRRALDRLEELAEEEGHGFYLEQGDVLLLNNWVTLHRRDAFVNENGPGRLLLRRWISTPGNRPLDERFAAHFGDHRAGHVRGGIRTQP